jgi:NADH-quinone oxidoreductase subunit L
MHLVEFPWLFLIPLLPLVGAAYAGLFGARIQRRWGERAIHIPTVALPWAAFGVACWGFFELRAGAPHDLLAQRLWTWMSIGPLQLEVAFTLDHLSAVMCLVVTFVGSLIHVYSTGYMRGDPSTWRFFAYLNLFLFAMLVLVLGDNLLLLFVGWEGVGLCSYLLISFWYTDLEKARAGMKAFLVNRVGDVGFVLGVSLLFWSLARSASVDANAPAPLALVTTSAEAPPALAGATGKVESQAAELAPVPATSLRFRDLERILSRPERRQGLASERWLGVSATTLVCLLLFLGATGKSAQFPLHVWLPDAMAGPTPVSALIHAATMVTAGVYLLARLHFLFALSPPALTVVTVVGAATALLAAGIGLFQHDIKKVLAYSTVSQLGFMFVALGVGAFWVAIFHLVTHALFKACLFLGSGSVILGCHHEQDMRKMGGLRRLMPVTAATYLVACLAIAGFPFFSGFFSKDEILWRVFDTGDLLLPGGGLLPWLVASLAATGTSYYVFRSYYLTFTGTYRGVTAQAPARQAAADTHSAPDESPRSMTVPLVVLAALAAVAGAVGLPEAWHFSNYFAEWLEPVFVSSVEAIHHAGHGHGVEWMLMALSVLLALVGFALARWLYRDQRHPLPARLAAALAASPAGALARVHRVFYRKYYLDELYDAALVRRSLDLARYFAWLDQHAVDGLVNLAGYVGRMCGELQGLIDRWLVDGLVNSVGDVLITAGHDLRRLQTGRIQSYLVALVAGSALLVLVTYVVRW